MHILAAWTLLMFAFLQTGCGADDHSGHHQGDMASAKVVNGPVNEGVKFEITEGLLDAYFKLHAALSADSLNEISNLAASLSSGQNVVELTRLLNASGIGEARLHFYQLSKRILQNLGDTDLENGMIKIAYCPMAFDNRGAYWLQTGHEILNPYFGARMLRCGIFKDPAALTFE